MSFENGMTPEMEEANKTRIARDLASPDGISKREQNIAIEKITAILQDSNLSLAEREALVDEALLLKGEKVKTHKTTAEGTASSSDTQPDTDKNAGPSLGAEVALTTAQMAGFAALGIASPVAAMAAIAAARNYVQFVSQSHDGEGIAQENPLQSNVALAAADPLEAAPGKTVSSEIAYAAPIADTGEADRKENQEKEKLAEEAKNSANRADAFITAKDRDNIDRGVAALSAAEAELAAGNVKETTAKLLRDAPDNNPELARKVEENGVSSAPANMLVIGDVSRGQSGALPSQAVGKAQAPSVSTSRSTA